MLVMQAAILLFVLVTATVLVLTRDPRNQVVGLSFYGLLLALMFFLYQAPDVALSQITIGAVALPLMFMLALTRIRRDRERAERADEKQKRNEEKRGDRPEESAA